MILVFLLALTIADFVVGIPPPAAEFYGNVTFNGTAAPVNTNITAYDVNGTLCGMFFIGIEGYYGLLSCDGDDINTTEDEGALSDENITFRINNRSASASGNYSWVSGRFSRVDLRENYPPSMLPISNQTLVVGVPFQYNVTATDPDNDTLYYYDNTSLFEINLLTGFINFTPSTGEDGNYSVTISVSDGFFSVSQVVGFDILAGYCGDMFCSIYESCTTCSEDCGSCPTGGAVGGGGGGGGAKEIKVEEVVCKEDWVCTEWSECFQNGTQVRTCYDKNNCGTEKKKPVTIKSCIPPGTCHDGIQNQGEEGIDCGGPCPPCRIFVEAEAYAKLPFEEVPKPVCGDGVCDAGENCDCPKDCREFGLFPWWILLVVIIALTVVMIITNIVMYFLKYKKRINVEDYENIMRRVYLIYSLIVLTIIILAAYCYWLWWCWPHILIALIITAIILIILLIVFYTFYLYLTRYDEERKRKKIKQLLGTHLEQLKELTSVEGKLIEKIEDKLVMRIYELSKANSDLLKSFPELIGLYNNVRKLQTNRETKQRLYDIEQELIVGISNLREREDYKSMVGEDKVLQEIDEELKLLVGYLARKHKIVERVSNIKKRIDEGVGK